MTNAPDLATRLRDARLDLGLSQDFVASKLGIPRSALSDIERGKRNVAAPELEQLARLYGRSANELLTGQVDEVDESLRALARAASDLSADDRAEVLHFAQFLRNRSRSKAARPT